MKFSANAVVTRRLELQVQYHAAYLYWNVRGILAERWGHGPHFSAYGDQGDSILLTDLPGDKASLFGAYGLRVSALISELEDQSEIPQLSENWLLDCLQVLRPKVVTGAYYKVVYALPVQDASAVSSALFEVAPGLRDFLPAGYEEEHAAAQFQVRSTQGAEETMTTGIFGVYAPDQASALFKGHRDIDEGWSLAFIYESRVQVKDGTTKSRDLIHNLRRRAEQESRQLMTQNYGKVMARV